MKKLIYMPKSDIMKINPGKLSEIAESALQAFFKAELKSILADVSERNLCSRLALQFEREIQKFGIIGYYADTEYNRKQHGEVKTIINGKDKVIAITCDLIIHSRGEIIADDNLIAIEMAKPNKSLKTAQDDRERLMAMTKASYDEIWSNDGTTHPEHVCGYVWGLFLLVDRHSRQATLEWYAHGAPSEHSSVIEF